MLGDIEIILTNSIMEYKDNLYNSIMYSKYNQLLLDA
jgi:hypothetical protein